MTRFHFQRTLSLSVVFAAAAIFLQACVLGGDDNPSSSTSIEGRWEWVMDVITYKDGDTGETAVDTLTPAPGVFRREFLLIEDSVVKVVRYDEVFGVPDTFTLAIDWSEQQGWRFYDDSISIVRQGNDLHVTVFSIFDDGFGLDSTISRWYYKKHSGAFPPAEWALTAAGAPAEGEVWLNIRTIATWESEPYPDTNIADTSDAYSRNYLRVLDSVIYAVSYDSVEVVSYQRISANRWVDLEGDTLTVTRTGNDIRVSYLFDDGTFGGDGEVFVDLIPVTGAFPPAAWSVPLPQESEPNGVRIQANAAVLGQLREGALEEDDVDWYSFPAVAGQTYRIVTSGNLDTYLRLYGAGSSPIEENDDAIGLNSEIIWTAPTSGTYYFTVRGFADDEVGSYRVRVSPTTAQPTLAKQGASIKPPKREGKAKPSDASVRSRRGR